MLYAGDYSDCSEADLPELLDSDSEDGGYEDSEPEDSDSEHSDPGPPHLAGVPDHADARTRNGLRAVNYMFSTNSSRAAGSAHCASVKAALKEAGVGPDILEQHPDSMRDAVKATAHLRRNFVAIDVCVNDCMLFETRHRSLRRCRVCSEPRYKESGKREARRRFYHMPVADWMREFYSNPSTCGLSSYLPERAADHKRTHLIDDVDTGRAFREIVMPVVNAGTPLKDIIVLGVCYDGVEMTR